MGRSAEEVAAEHADAWMRIPGVVGVYGGENESLEPAIIVMIAVPEQVLRGTIPSILEGFPVVFEDATDLRPMCD